MVKPKIRLICFADSRLSKSMNRIKGEIKDFTLIDDAQFFTEKDFDPHFRQELHPVRHRRGYGYWKWKSYFVKRAFDLMNTDDILIWSDVGSTLNAKGEQRLKEYIASVRENEAGILAFRQEGNLERVWTKGDLFKFLGVYDNPLFTDSYQSWAGGFILRKTKLSQQMVDRWYDIHMNHYDLTTDKRSEAPNYPEFRENRHDQSVFSLLTKMYGAAFVSSSEVFCGAGGWEKQTAFPIWACQKKEFKESKLTKKLKAPYRWLQRKYLVVFENMYFNKQFKW